MRIGRYEVTGEIGRGGMGLVLRGRAFDGREVAIKLLHSSKRDAHARFQREGRLLAALGEAQGFVPCLETGDSPQGPFIVMPLIEGGTLRDRLTKGPFSLEEGLALAVALATAVGHAHERGIVHRDLKPENILFKDGKPLVTDLGLARHFDRAALDGSRSYALSRTGETRGTAGYMAPEQITDARVAKPSADVFALASIAYECLTGAPALGGGTVLEMFGRAETGQIVPPTSVRPDLPRWLDDVLLRALSYEPARRYQDGHAFARALRDRGEGERRSPLVPAAALLALVLLLAIGALAWLRRGPAPSAAKAEELLARGDTEGALHEAQRALDADVELAAAYAARAAVRAAKKDDPGAKADLDRAVELDPKLVIAWVRRGEHAIRTEDTERGIADFTRALELDPTNVHALYGRAKMVGSEGHLDRARADLDRAIELAPRSDACWGLRGAVRGNAGDVDGGLADLSHAIELAPRVAEHWSNRAGARFHKHDFDACVADATRALELDPRDTNALATRAAVLMQRDGRYEDALADINRALAINPRSVTALINRSGYYIRQRIQPESAIADLERASKIAPGNRTIWANLAVARHMAGDEEGALAAMNRVLLLAPNDLAMRVDRAAFHLERKEFREALADSTKAIEDGSEEALAWRVRGLARAELGDKDGAITDLEKFLALAPDDGAAPYVRKRVAELAR